MGSPQRALFLSTFAFTACFAVWTIFAIVGVQIKKELSLNDAQFGLLIATPILTGSISRVFLGLLSDRFGGRLVLAILMLLVSGATFTLSAVSTYPVFLLVALGIGFAGGSFAIGVSYVSRWYERARQGAALGVFGVGTIGTAITTLAAPTLVVSYGWRTTAQIYAVAIVAVGILFYLLSAEDPVVRSRSLGTAAMRKLSDQLAPLARLQVWRFSLYYFFVFGAFVALASWLPRYYMGVYDLSIERAGLLTTAFALPAAAFRALGGFVSDRLGARVVMYVTFMASAALCFVLSYPATDYIVHGIEGPIRFTLAIGLAPFVAATTVLGFFMALGMAAVYKHIPVYYPEHVGAVGGLVGSIGGLGGFILPIAFGVMNDLIGVWTSSFMLLFALVTTALAWMHGAIRLMERARLKELKTLPELPEMAELHDKRARQGTVQESAPVQAETQSSRARA
jgi:NNP family nitrate/nitrite transporter-like MFS transporter